MQQLPYSQKISDTFITRTFSKNVDNSELVWHRDRLDRSVTIINGKGWYFQFDEELPFELVENLNFFISKERIHRLIKSDQVESDLLITIKEIYE